MSSAFSSAKTTAALNKGDVAWAKWRDQPFWPAVVSTFKPRKDPFHFEMQLCKVQTSQVVAPLIPLSCSQQITRVHTKKNKSLDKATVKFFNDESPSLKVNHQNLKPWDCPEKETLIGEQADLAPLEIGIAAHLLQSMAVPSDRAETTSMLRFP